jgi:hypothetical protein
MGTAWRLEVRSNTALLYEEGRPVHPLRLPGSYGLSNSLTVPLGAPPVVIRNSYVPSTPPAEEASYSVEGVPEISFAWQS